MFFLILEQPDLLENKKKIIKLSYNSHEVGEEWLNFYFKEDLPLVLSVIQVKPLNMDEDWVLTPLSLL